MDTETIRALDRLRHDMIAESPGMQRIKSILTKYYPAGTKVIITKDWWKIENPEEQYICKN